MESDVSKDWMTKHVSDAPMRMSPSGDTEIRELLSFSEGGIAHATALVDKTPEAGSVSDFGELFYVLEGQGALWRATGALEDVVPLSAGVCASIPPGIDYQYRAGKTSLKFLVSTAPQFQREKWVKAGRRHWDSQGRAVSPPIHRPGPWMTKSLPKDRDYLAPDGSEIRLLLTFDAGGLAHCKLPPGTSSGAVRHQTVKEVWYVLSGRGKMWRGRDKNDETVDITPGTCLTIPTGVSFQFRAASDAPLEIMIGTFPAWPGPGEAEPLWVSGC